MPMKILFVVGKFPKLSETFILNQIACFCENDDDVTILSENPSYESKVHEGVSKYSLNKKTVYYNFPTNQFRKLIKTAVLMSENLSNSLNLLKSASKIKSFHPIFAAPALKRNKKTDFDIIICHFGPSGNLAVALRDLGVLKGKIITVFHGFDMNAYLKSKGKDIYNGLFRKGDAFLPISNFWRQKLIDLGCEESKITTRYMGVDVNMFNYNTTVPDQKNIKILSVARLIEKKGIDYAIESIEILAGELPEISYKIIGDGPLKKALEEKVRHLKIVQNVQFLGSLSQDEIIPEIEQADFFLLPSVIAADGDMEGIPVGLMEAMAMGKIVISTRHSGIPELIQHGVTGFLAPERDSSSLARLIKEVLDLSKEQLELIKINARKHVELHFNQELQNEVLLNDVCLLSSQFKIK